MATRTSVHAAIDDRAKSAFTSNGTPITFGNTKDLSLSEGANSFVRCRTHFPDTGQHELGRPTRSRTEGVVVFTLYVRKGDGDGERNRLSDVIAANFRNQQFAEATFYGMRELPYRETENWCLTGVQVPFYFDEVN